MPERVIDQALDYALMAPNSSNAQTWDFYWPKNSELKKRVAYCCFSQSAARTASDLIVVTATPRKWRRSWQPLRDFVSQKKMPKAMISYYEKVFPYTYYQDPLGIAGLVKTLISFVVGIFRPVPRWPLSRRDLRELSIKSAALAAENFVLAVTAQGFATCMMEGFDSWRLRRSLRLAWGEQIVMVIAVGEEAKENITGPQFRLPKEQVVHILN